MNIDHTLYQKHCNCEIAVDRNYIPKKILRTIRNNTDLAKVLKNNSTPPALICITHEKWLKWLSPADADAIESAMAESEQPPPGARMVRIDDLPTTILR